MGVSDMAIDSMAYIKEIGPLLLLVGGVMLADLTIGFLINLFKQIKAGKVKW